MRKKKPKQPNVTSGIDYFALSGDTILECFHDLERQTPVDARPAHFTEFLITESIRMVVDIYWKDKPDITSAYMKDAYEFAAYFACEYASDSAIMGAIDKHWNGKIPTVFASALEYARKNGLNSIDKLKQYYCEQGDGYHV